MASLSGEPGGKHSGRDAALARIRERGERVAESEAEQALARLRARGELSEQEKEAVEALAERLADRLLAVPVAGLQETDGETAEVALELFGD